MSGITFYSLKSRATVGDLTKKNTSLVIFIALRLGRWTKIGSCFDAKLNVFVVKVELVGVFESSGENANMGAGASVPAEQLNICKAIS